MTVKQKQCLLCYLGYYDGPVDGIWGPKSDAAMKAFCDVYGTEDALPKAVGSDDWWGRIRHFTRQEFACKCGKYCDGYPAQMQRRVVELAEGARLHFGRPGIVVSGLRCKEWNRLQSGVANSQHMYGEAVDLKIQGITAGELLAYIQKQPGVRYAYAINETNVHFDIAKGERFVVK